MKNSFIEQFGIPNLDCAITDTDSYKLTHWRMEPSGLYKVYSYGESRGGKFPEIEFFGLQPILMKLEGRVFTRNDIEQLDFIAKQHFGMDTFNKNGFIKMLDKYNGLLPIKVCAVKEGAVLPVSDVALTVESTDKEFPFITQFLEGIFMRIWYTSTVAGYSRQIKKMMQNYLRKTDDAEVANAHINFMLHDFGNRGTTCHEQSVLGGMAHLTNFLGTDTVPALFGAIKYYGAEGAVGYSVPAIEHTNILSWGRNGEYACIRNLFNVFPSDSIISIVSDTYDLFGLVEKGYCGEFKDIILQRDGKTVIRPDSGDPVEINRKLIHMLWDNFGGTITSKGFKKLDKHIGIIQGDGVTYESIDAILSMLVEEGFAVSNIVFGSGGGLLQKHDRDEQKWAIKGSHVQVHDEERDICKTPKTDMGKRSKSGRLKLIIKDGQYQTVGINEYPEYENQLLPVFENGKILKTYTFDEVRANCALEPIKELEPVS